VSYVFYGWWDYRFLSLLLISTFIDYFVGIGLGKTDNQKQRKLLLALSIVCNLGLLGFFKYFNFFVDNVEAVFTFLGRPIELGTLRVILPVGISFYTFQTMSYSIDVYRRAMSPTKDFIAFASYVTFFPQLVAGPIERATNLLPQFSRRREFSYDDAVDGLTQIAWGLIQKVVIADACAPMVTEIFANHGSYPASVLVVGAVLFAFQIYGDFSGYSDIAIGTANLFGFSLMRNFAYPYFSRDIAEFWRRWHISLSTWFRDYLYFPLGGSRKGKWISVRNTLLIFIVSGFWHGANWTFIAWGVLNAACFIPLLLSSRNRTHLGTVATNRFLPTTIEALSICGTFAITSVGWVFFRARSVGDAIAYLSEIASPSILSAPHFKGSHRLPLLAICILAFIAAEWTGRNDAYPLARLRAIRARAPRWAVYLGVLSLIYLFGSFSESIEFIYFQF
jgi:D-alanyl-lipoteichoic acid acyltransferase DltB (MBOAT superfamily)